jgi:hypothetical protein
MDQSGQSTQSTQSSSLPTDEQATQFVIMLRAGLPAEHAIQYFVQSEDMRELSVIMSKWMKSRKVAQAQRLLDGKSWQEMTLDEQMRTALDQHYAAQAYMLRTVHYLTADSGEKAKLDSARNAIEAKLAGTSGKLTAMDQFFQDIKTGVVKLNKPLGPAH